MRDAFRREKSCTREPSSYNLVVGFSSRVFAGNGSGRASCAVRLYLLVFIACVTVWRSRLFLEYENDAK